MNTTPGSLTRFLVAVCLPLSCVACAGGNRAVEYFPSQSERLRSYPFSESVRVGDTLYLSGQIGTDPASGALVEGGIEPEARQTIENMQAALARHGLDLSHVVKCTVFLADIDEWPTLNAVYSEYFSAPYPARSALAASGLALDSRVEIECIAVFPPGH